ncbi:MAG TPA: NAD-dependent epimerase/dehydratase family protein [Nitrospirae bacterium]|nr:NAD-dependent epimerase/dehydratase family protein [Nitrospirota bacterium]
MLQLLKTMIFIAGATGFVGRHLIRSLSSGKYKVRCLVRSDKEAGLCTSPGFETTKGDITDSESLKGKLEGVGIVVHLVGIIKEQGEGTFEKIHIEGTKNLVDEAKFSDVEHFFFQSALGADLRSPFKYLRTKAEAEEIVKGSGLPYTIFRPSLIIGPGDGFTENIKELLRLGPVVPVPGDGKARFQPIFIDDWVRCFLKIIDSRNFKNRVFEFGGPEHLSYNEILKIIMKEMEIKNPIVHIPPAITKAGLPFIQVFRSLGRTVGMKMPDVSPEQIDLLQIDNITDMDSVEHLFGFRPVGFEETIRKTLRNQPDKT